MFNLTNIAFGTGNGKYYTADDVAAMAQFLLSDDASWITGHILHVDGGMSSIKMF